ncbi:MAG: hypothetical protein HY558_03385 [Euryarchaeota archaeon]|nr:hypothetical protein [Euryarchaeota archaeon]
MAAEDILRSKERLTKLASGLDRVTSKDLQRRIESIERRIDDLSAQSERPRTILLSDELLTRFRTLEAHIVDAEMDSRLLAGQVEESRLRAERQAHEATTRLNSLEIGLQETRHSLEERAGHLLTAIDEARRERTELARTRDQLQRKLGEHELLAKRLGEAARLLDEATLQRLRDLPQAMEAAQMQKIALEAMHKSLDGVAQEARQAAADLGGLAGLPSRVEAIEATLGGLPPRLDQMEKAREAQGAHLGRLESELRLARDDTRQALQEAQEERNTLKGRLPAAEELQGYRDQLQQQGAHLQEARRTAHEAHEGMAALRQELRALREATPDLRRLAGLETRITEAEMVLGRLQGAVEGSLNELARMRGLLGALERLESLPRLESQVQEHDKGLGHLAQIQEELLHQAAQMAQGVQELQRLPQEVRRLAEHEERLAQHDNALAKLGAFGEQVLEQLEALRAAGGTPPEVRQALQEVPRLAEKTRETELNQERLTRLLEATQTQVDQMDSTAQELRKGLDALHRTGALETRLNELELQLMKYGELGESLLRENEETKSTLEKLRRMVQQRTGEE